MLKQSQKELLDSINQGNARRGELVRNLDRTEKVVSLLYDFDSDGGATGDVSLKYTDDDGNQVAYTVEEDAIVTKILAHETDAFTSGGAATITVKAGGTSLTGALAFDSGFTGLDNLALASSADAIAVSSGAELKITIGAQALTAGTVRFYVYLLPQRTT